MAMMNTFVDMFSYSSKLVLGPCLADLSPTVHHNHLDNLDLNISFGGMGRSRSHALLSVDNQSTSPILAKGTCSTFRSTRQNLPIKLNRTALQKKRSHTQNPSRSYGTSHDPH